MRVHSWPVWSLADQVLSSASNYGVALAALYVMTPSEYGAFALILIAVSLSALLGRAVGCEALIRSNLGPVKPRPLWRSPELISGLLVGGPLSLALTSLGYPMLGVLGGVLPPICARHESLRSLWLVRCPQVAVLMDAAWVAGSILGVGWSIWGPVDLSPAILVGGWMLGALTGVLVGQHQAKGLPVGSMELLTTVSYGAEALLMNAANQFVLYAVGITVGVDGLALVRASLAFLAPVSGIVLVAATLGLSVGLRAQYNLGKYGSALAVAALMLSLGSAWLIQAGSTIVPTLIGGQESVVLLLGVLLAIRSVVQLCLPGLRVVSAPHLLLRMRVLQILLMVGSVFILRSFRESGIGVLDVIWTALGAESVLLVVVSRRRTLRLGLGAEGRTLSNAP